VARQGACKHLIFHPPLRLSALFFNLNYSLIRNVGLVYCKKGGDTMNEEEIGESLGIENIGKLPFSVVMLILMAFVFALSSADMTAREAISALVFMLIIFIPLFLIDIRREERKV
jgi:hypothetical protein